MGSVFLASFVHRMNGNGTTVSICQRCYATVAASTWEADLDEAEAAHQCERARLRQFEPTHKPPFRATWTPAQRLNKIA